MLPDFIIIGAMKCGTSTLQVQLAAQQGVFMSTPKEPNYFSDDAVFARGQAWYEGLFAAAAATDLKGEASTHYTKLPTYPQTVARMSAMLKAPRLIYVMRDPIRRAVSHYMHEWSMGNMGDDPVAAFDAHPELIDYSRYAMQIQPYLDQYGRDAIHLVSFEQMTAAPQRILSGIGAFLGRDDLVWDDTIGAQNVSAERVRRLPLHGLIVDNPVATALRRTLVPKALRNRIRAARQMKTRPELPADLRARLAGLLAEDQARLAALFPGDPALAPLAGQGA